jgi:hypothetical protein
LGKINKTPAYQLYATIIVGQTALVNGLKRQSFGGSFVQMHKVCAISLNLGMKDKG